MTPDTADVSNLSTTQRLSLIRASEAVLKKEPKNVEALVNLGVLLVEEKQYNSAIDAFKRALSIRKRDETILYRLADACEKNYDFPEAKKHVRKLLRLKPANPIYLMLLAQVQEELGHLEKAKQTWEKLNRFHVDNALYMESLASCLRRMGQMAEANAIYTKIQEDIEPGHASTLYLFVNSKKITKEEAGTLLDHIDKAISVTNDPVLEPNLNYAAGKVLSDIEEYDRAFTFYRKANLLKTSKSTNELVLPFNSLKKHLTKDFLLARKGTGHSTNQPIFILGMPRSGTTLSESYLGAHSKITAGDELGAMISIAGSFGLRKLSSNEFQSRLGSMPTDKYLEFAEFYLNKTRSAHGNTPHFTDKLPHNFMNLGFIKLLFPNAKIIHCRRHPLDNCVSLYTNSMRKTHNEYKSDLQTLGLYYRQYLQLMQHWRETFPGGFHEVYYEDVVTNTELNARAMIDYLDLEWEDSVLERKNSQKGVKTLSVWQVRQPVYTTSAGRWKKYEKHLGPLIDALGPVVDDYETELATLSEKAANA